MLVERRMFLTKRQGRYCQQFCLNYLCRLDTERGAGMAIGGIKRQVFHKVIIDTQGDYKLQIT